LTTTPKRRGRPPKKKPADTAAPKAPAEKTAQGKKPPAKKPARKKMTAAERKAAAEKRKKAAALKRRREREARERARKKREKELLELSKYPIDERHAAALIKLARSEGEEYRKKGRKTLFRDFMFKEAEALAGLGFTMQKIADLWGVSRMTLNRWSRKYPAFCYTIKRGREAALQKTVRSLHDRANGFETLERKFIIVAPELDKSGKVIKQGRRILAEEKVKTLAPEVSAIAFYLKNMDPENWRDAREIDIPSAMKDGKLQIELVDSRGEEIEGEILEGPDGLEALPEVVGDDIAGDDLEAAGLYKDPTDAEMQAQAKDAMAKRPAPAGKDPKFAEALAKGRAPKPAQKKKAAPAGAVKRPDSTKGKPAASKARCRFCMAEIPAKGACPSCGANNPR